MASDGGHYNIQLNNYLQGIKKLHTLAYYDNKEGPDHAPTWVVYALIDNEEYGEGRSSRRWQAKDIAAKQALIKLGQVPPDT